MKDNNTPVPFKIKFLDKKIVKTCKEFLNICFKLKEKKQFAFQYSARGVSRAIVILMLEKQLDMDHANGIIKFLADENENENENEDENKMEERYI